MSNVTQILSRIEQGDPSAAELLLPLADDVCFATPAIAGDRLLIRSSAGIYRTEGFR